MRTAIISGLTHAGKGVLISGKEVPLLKQLEVFNTFRKGAITNGAHPEFKEVSYQENDGYEQLLTFRTPEDQKKHEARRAEEKARHQKQIDAELAREGLPRATLPKPAEKAAPHLETPNPKPETVSTNEFKREELQVKSQGELLAIMKSLVDAKRLEQPAKTSPTALIEAILAAKPATPSVTDSQS